MNQRARQLRRHQTDAERHLWCYLRRRALEGFKFRRQHPVGRYIVDFACTERSLVLELDGGQHDEERAYDATRTAALEAAGFRVLRFWNHDVLKQTEVVLEVIRDTVLEQNPRGSAASPSSRPSPPLGEKEETRPNAAGSAPALRDEGTSGEGQ